ncbi:MAG: hypothetical protein K2Q24_17935 [Chitinophagaceae bacterium]|jgi:hypothetical protein|nr:hypothetical protein [Chitinophagaceae bacterium]
MKLFFQLAVVLYLSCFACRTPKSSAGTVLHQNQETFWKALQQLCGNAYQGTVVAAPSNDTVFKNKKLYMHVRACKNNLVRIPFVVGDNRSRTWVFTKTESQLELKHDHRHIDGTPDSTTMYGGSTSNNGTATMQFFPADLETTNLLPTAGGNVWWVELIPGISFTYNLRRLGTDRLFSIRFDLTKTVPAPEAPWGWKD